MREAPKTLAIIPAHNEESSIGDVVAGVKKEIAFADPVLGALRPLCPWDKVPRAWAEGPRVQDKCILVINDGSLDATAEIAEGREAFSSLTYPTT